MFLAASAASYAWSLIGGRSTAVRDGERRDDMRLPQGAERLIILVLIVLLFGAKRLPDAARGVGRSLRIFKAETKGLMERGQATPPAPAVRRRGARRPAAADRAARRPSHRRAAAASTPPRPPVMAPAPGPTRLTAGPCARARRAADPWPAVSGRRDPGDRRAR